MKDIHSEKSLSDIFCNFTGSILLIKQMEVIPFSISLNFLKLVFGHLTYVIIKCFFYRCPCFQNARKCSSESGCYNCKKNCKNCDNSIESPSISNVSKSVEKQDREGHAGKVSRLNGTEFLKSANIDPRQTRWTVEETLVLCEVVQLSRQTPRTEKAIDYYNHVAEIGEFHIRSKTSCQITMKLKHLREHEHMFNISEKKVIKK